MTDTTPTRERLLEAALQLVVEDGVQAVTHRRVEEAAGVARGSTRYHFGSRDDLLAALIGHLAERSHALLAQGVEALRAGVDGAGMGIGELLSVMISDREGAIARFELYLYAVRRPELADVLSSWSRTFVDVGAAYLGGGPQARRQAALLSAALDGLVLHALASPDTERDAAAPQWFISLLADVRG